jgi:hypothetical protein
MPKSLGTDPARYAAVPLRILRGTLARCIDVAGRNEKFPCAPAAFAQKTFGRNIVEKSIEKSGVKKHQPKLSQKRV